MLTDDIASIVKSECTHAGFEVCQILLFGSRAKGAYRVDSDWDILACLNTVPDPDKKRKLSSAIRTRCAKLDLDVDIILKSMDAVRTEKDDTGLLTYYAVKEGIVL